jgi:hypothetical protein
VLWWTVSGNSGEQVVDLWWRAIFKVSMARRVKQGATAPHTSAGRLGCCAKQCECCRRGGTAMVLQ